MDQTQMSAENRVLVGYFDEEARAERALNDLQNAGFTSAHIGVAHRGPRPVSRAPGASAAGSEAKNSAEDMWDKVRSFFHRGAEHDRADDRARTEAAGEQADADASAYTHDDLHDSLTGMSVPEERSRYFSRRLRSSENGALVTVNAGERANIAEFILRDNGADVGEDVGERDTSGDTYAERVSQQSAGELRNAEPVAAEPVANASGAPIAARTEVPDAVPQPARPAGTLEGAQDVQNLQLLGEVLRVRKERIDRGEVAVRKEVVTETQTIQVPVQREELVIEQHPPAGRAEAAGPGQEIRIPLSQETASVDKDTVVREQVTVGKKPVQETREVSGDVRHEELVVDDRTRRAVNE
jgi:uncharacterized protein (TIGR02271 family)